MSKKELSSKFLSLLRYVPYIIDEKPKIQRFLSCLPFSFKDRMNTPIQKPLRKDNFCYEQSRNKREDVPNWKVKRTNNFEQRRKIFKSNINFGNNSRNYNRNTYEGTYFKSNTQ